MLNYNQDGHRQRTVNWCDTTGGTAAAFDFTTKGARQYMGPPWFCEPTRMSWPYVCGTCCRRSACVGCMSKLEGAQ